jgi:hypothetical protein
MALQALGLDEVLEMALQALGLDEMLEMALQSVQRLEGLSLWEQEYWEFESMDLLGPVNRLLPDWCRHTLVQERLGHLVVTQKC